MLNINYIEWKSNLKIDPKWVPPLDELFIPHILPILASIPLVKNSSGKISPKLTYTGIPDIVHTPNGDIPGPQVQALLGFVALARRSVLLPKTTQTKYPQYGLYTPLAMYAHKLYNNISYGSWDKTPTDYLHVFLGTTLFTTYKSAVTNGKPLINPLSISKLRKEALTFKSGIKIGTQDKATAHRCNLLTLDVQDSDKITKKKYSKYAVMSFLQIWITNVEYRDTEAMILDFYDWDNIPQALDSTISKPVTKEVIEEKSDVDKLWDIL